LDGAAEVSGLPEAAGDDEGEGLPSGTATRTDCCRPSLDTQNTVEGPSATPGTT